MSKSEENPKSEYQNFAVRGPSSFVVRASSFFRHSFVIRHSDFVIILSRLYLNMHPGRKFQFLQLIHGFSGRINNIKNSFVGPDLKLFA